MEELRGKLPSGNRANRRGGSCPIRSVTNNFQPKASPAKVVSSQTNGPEGSAHPPSNHHKLMYSIGNDAWHAYYGFTRGQVFAAQPWLPYVADSCLERWDECFKSFSREPGPRTMELKLKDRVYTVQEGDHIIENGMYILVTGFSEFKEDGTVDHIEFWVTGGQ